MIPARQRPRLLYVITRAERGGAQTHVLSLALAMRRQFAVEIATGERGFLTRAADDAGIPVHVLRHLGREIRPVADVLGFRELVSLFNEVRPDLVHLHTFKAGFLGRFAAHWANVPSFYTVHMWPFEPVLPLTWRLAGPLCERLAATCCRRVITVSEKAARQARERNIGNAQQIVAIVNGIPDHPRRARLIHDRALTCTMVGRFTPLKDQPLLLKAFAQIEAPVRLRMVGDGDTLASAQTLARSLGIHQRVEFTGSRGDVPELLADSDLLVLASKTESMPISILEGMRAGLPVIASNVGGVSEEVTHNETGLLVAPGSVDELAAALRKLLTDQSLRVAMGAAGRRRFETTFLADTMLDRTRGLYEEVLRERPLAGGESPVSALVSNG